MYSTKAGFALVKKVSFLFVHIVSTASSQGKNATVIAFLLFFIQDIQGSSSVKTFSILFNLQGTMSRKRAISSRFHRTEKKRNCNSVFSAAADDNIPIVSRMFILPFFNPLCQFFSTIFLPFYPLFRVCRITV